MMLAEGAVEDETEGEFCCDAQRCPLVGFVLDGQFA